MIQYICMFKYKIANERNNDMTKIDIFSGFLGAGKTTLIKKLIAEGYNKEKVVLIENEFGEVGIDGGFLRDAGIEITEMNSGCICCSLVGDFGEALKKVLAEFSPERIIIEPSGVGKLSDVIKAVLDIKDNDLHLNGLTAIVDAKKCKMYMKNFGEFFNNQIENAKTVILSHTDGLLEEKITEAVALIREHNKDAVIVTTPWDKLSGEKILSAIEKENTLEEEMEKLMHENHHHHHHEHDEECECGHHHHHEHDEECGCGHHHHHHDHHADEVFASWGIETTQKFKEEKIKEILEIFAKGTEYGMVLRAKGIVEAETGEWIHFDYVPGEADVRTGCAEVTGRICVIGAGIDKEKIRELFM